MLIFAALCVLLTLSILLHYWYTCRLDPPLSLAAAVKLINLGVIPHEFSGHIQVKYEVGEECSMSAQLERTFVQRGRPMWIVRLVLNDGHVVSDTAVLFDNNGDLYQ